MKRKTLAPLLMLFAALAFSRRSFLRRLPW